ncbi:hypothetical protein [Ralstonia holmesii]|uniref:hypothetical protein n=1 Tax=Ralstonia holmesii TaxID=3058602 RepID=UPI0028F56063|nr:hypothetical protein [Ralstonia sp. LMG 32967]CAJ0698599.1 hypothetical protein R11007_02838 [Ralstonia sp. LMG 32967]
MDWLTFITKMAEALAWPITALILAISFRKRLAEKLHQLLELTLPGGTKAVFESKLEKVEAEVVRDEPAVAQNPGNVRFSIHVPDARGSDDALALKANPTGVVMEKWKEWETAARAAYFSAYPERASSNKYFTRMRLLSELRKAGLLTEEDQKVANELGELRNLVAHTSGTSLSKEQVNRYASLIDLLVDGLFMRVKARQPEDLPGQDAVSQG